jgi:opacity protein-like surface antigen
MRVQQIVSALAFSLCAAPVAGQAAVFTITPFGAFMSWRSTLPETFLVLGRQNDIRVENGVLDESGGGLGTMFGVRLRDRFGLETSFSYASTTVTSTNRPAFTIDLFVFTGNASLYLPVFGAGRELFVGAGVGAKLYDFLLDSSKAETDLAYNVGGGLNLAISDRLGVRLEARDYMSNFGSRLSGVSSVRQHDLLITAGLTLSVRNDPDPKPNQ